MTARTGRSILGPVGEYDELVPWKLRSNPGRLPAESSVTLTLNNLARLDEGPPRYMATVVHHTAAEAREFAQHILTLADEVDPPIVNVPTPDTARRDEAIAEVREERVRQVLDGYTPEHDDTHSPGEMLSLAHLYVYRGADLLHPEQIAHRRTALIKAAAVLVANIEHIDRELARNRDRLHAELDGAAR